MSSQPVPPAGHSRRDIAAYFLAEEACDADEAIGFVAETDEEQRRFDALVEDGVIASGPNGLWYLDREAIAAASQRKRRKRAAFAVFGATIAAAAAVLFAG